MALRLESSPLPSNHMPVVGVAFAGWVEDESSRRGDTSAAAEVFRRVSPEDEIEETVLMGVRRNVLTRVVARLAKHEAAHLA
jgi:hypothetical protein